VDKRFLYLILVIVIVLVIILAWQDSKNKQTALMDKIDITPTPAIITTPGFLSPAPTQASQTNQDQNSSSSALQTLEGGLKIQDMVVGTGKEVVSGNTIAVNYIGYLENGQKFDSSVDRNKPFIFQIGAGQVIQGWDTGIIGMKEGGQRRLFIPAAMAYGDQGAGNGLIPPNSNLIFDVQLLSIE
jgi:FKBP-type peptidyl-prolyl cis-trans isomerase